MAGPYFQWADHSFVVKTVHGNKIAGNTIDLIQRFVYFFGIWEPLLTDWIRWRLKPGDIFVDVGANIGYFTSLASGLVGDDGRVIAVEASPRIFQCLMANLERNCIRNTDALNIAASDRKGKVNVYCAEEGNAGETSIVQQEGREIETEVDSDTLSTILGSYDKDRIRMVKIDVEGAEYLVIEGMRELLSGNPAMDVFMEINPETLRRHGQTATGIFEIFDKAGYSEVKLARSTSERTPR